MNDQESRGVTGETLYEAEFDPKITRHGPVVAMLWAVVTVVGIPFIPFVFLFGLWYYPEFLRRMSARLTTHAVEIRKGVFSARSPPSRWTGSPTSASTTIR